jgi:hypothetical protein
VDVEESLHHDLSVPVMVEFWPDARSASAKTVLANGVPSSGERSWYASQMSATSWYPLRWKVAAARMRIAALMQKAKSSASVESIVA